MLSGESAMGQYPEKELAVLSSVSLRIERKWREEKCYANTPFPIQCPLVFQGRYALQLQKWISILLVTPPIF